MLPTYGSENPQFLATENIFSKNVLPHVRQ
jgi:hypothetical protein